jgi:alpha-amylase
VEFNFAGLPPGIPDRYFRDGSGQHLGDLASQLDLQHEREITLVDEWLGIELQLRANRPGGFWTYPVGTVNGSEAGFELVYQSVAVVPHWPLIPDPSGRWTVVFELSLQSTRVPQPCESNAVAVSG